MRMFRLPLAAGKPEEENQGALTCSQQQVRPAVPFRAGKPEEECLGAFVELLMRRRLVQRVDRRYQNPKPGKTKRVKWPRKLVDVLDVNLQVGSRLQALFAKCPGLP